MTIAVLEDNDDRIAAMEDGLADKFPFFNRRYFRSAPEALAWLDEHISEVVCLALDHDLEPPDHPPGFEPGTGRDVADALAGRPASCPIVIHTSNAPAAVGMEMVLIDAGWSVTRVLPYADLSWIREAWLPAVRDAIVQTAPVPLPAR